MPWPAVSFNEILPVIKSQHDNPALPTLKVYKNDGTMLFQNAKQLVIKANTEESRQHLITKWVSQCM